LQSLKVTLIDGSYHPVDSDTLSFETAARIALKEACRKAEMTLLEPIMRLEVVAPDANIGDITGDLNKRRAMVEGVSSRGNLQVVKAKVPMANMFGYVTALRTITSGRGTSTMEYSHHQELTPAMRDELIKKIKGLIYL
jgi:elongation factor G